MAIAKALFDCLADDPTSELSFKKGDIITGVVDSVEPGWSTGRLQGTDKRGLFPLNHVVILPDDFRPPPSPMDSAPSPPLLTPRPSLRSKPSNTPVFQNATSDDRSSAETLDREGGEAARPLLRSGSAGKLNSNILSVFENAARTAAETRNEDLNRSSRPSSIAPTSPRPAPKPKPSFLKNANFGSSSEINLLAGGTDAEGNGRGGDEATGAVATPPLPRRPMTPTAVSSESARASPALPRRSEPPPTTTRTPFTTTRDESSSASVSAAASPAPRRWTSPKEELNDITGASQPSYRTRADLSQATDHFAQGPPGSPFTARRPESSYIPSSATGFTAPSQQPRGGYTPLNGDFGIRNSDVNDTSRNVISSTARTPSWPPVNEPRNGSVSASGSASASPALPRRTSPTEKSPPSTFSGPPAVPTRPRTIVDTKGPSPLNQVTSSSSPSSPILPASRKGAPPPLPARKPTGPISPTSATSTTDTTAATTSNRSAPSEVLFSDRSPMNSPLLAGARQTVKSAAQDQASRSATSAVSSAFAQGKSDLSQSRYGGVAEKIPGRDRMFDAAETVVARNVGARAADGVGRAVDDPVGTYDRAAVASKGEKSDAFTPAWPASFSTAFTNGGGRATPPPPPLPSRTPVVARSVDVKARPEVRSGVTSMADMTVESRARYSDLFDAHDGNKAGYLSGLTVRGIFIRSGLDNDALKQIWLLSDRDEDGLLSKDEFITGMWLIDERLRGVALPPVP